MNDARPFKDKTKIIDDDGLKTNLVYILYIINSSFIIYEYYEFRSDDDDNRLY